MYKIYYLTSEEDFNIPMYVGMTKLDLNKRLKQHLVKRNNRNKNNIWKNKRDNKISIHLIEDNISDFKTCIRSELFWINFWKKINNDLNNSITYMLAEHPYTNSIENIKRNISEGVIAKRCKNIVALDKNQKFLKVYRTIKSASLDLKIKEECIIKNLKNTSKCTKYIFIYEEEFDETKDYSYKSYIAKNRKSPIKKAEVSENCRNAVKKEVKIKNILTNDILTFDTKQKASFFLGFSSSYYDRLRLKNKPYNNYILL
jgi:predicted GIY-YIG superfamily endonuclease